MPSLDLIVKICLIASSVIGVLLWADNWVHKRNSDSATQTADHNRLAADVQALRLDVQRIEAALTAKHGRVERLALKFEEAEKRLGQREERIDSDLKRIEATAAQNHNKAMLKCEALDGVMDAWATQINEWTRRIVTIEAWLNRPVRVKEGRED